MTDEASHRADILQQQQDIKALELTWSEEKQPFILKGVFRRNLVRGDYYSPTYTELSINTAHSYSSVTLLGCQDGYSQDLPQPGQVARKGPRNPQLLPQDTNPPPMTSVSKRNDSNFIQYGQYPGIHHRQDSCRDDTRAKRTTKSLGLSS